MTFIVAACGSSFLLLGLVLMYWALKTDSRAEVWPLVFAVGVFLSFLAFITIGVTVGMLVASKICT